MKDSGLVFLKNFSELSISGEGSKDFLQGQISADIDKIDENNSSLACLCNVKGRVISSFTLIKDTSGKNRFSLIGPKETIQRTERELRKYIPFYKSEMKIRNESNLFGCKEEISEMFLPWVTANNDAVKNSKDELSITLKGRPFEHKVTSVQKFHAKSFGLLMEHYKTVSQDQELKKTLVEAGAEEYLNA